MCVMGSNKLIEILNSNNLSGWQANGGSANDLCDSIYHKENELQIYLPNSVDHNPDQEQWNTYQLCSIANNSTEDYILENVDLNSIIKCLINR
jgi:hypothetical protein